MKLPESAEEVLLMLADQGSLAPGNPADAADDPLNWRHPDPYAGRLATTRDRTGLSCGVAWGAAKLQGQEVVLAASDLRFLSGSLGIREAASLSKSMGTAADRGAPFIWIARGSGACRGRR